MISRKVQTKLSYLHAGGRTLGLANDSMNSPVKSVAKNRWDLLQKAILTKLIPEPKQSPWSKRGFERYSALVQWSQKDSSLDDESVIEVVLSFGDQSFLVNLSRDQDSSYLFEIDALQGFDRTGRLCIWPSEQILAHFCLQQLCIFQGKRIIEIGGGFHSLAALVIAKFCTAEEVVLTDGEGANVKKICQSLKLNDFLTRCVTGSVLRWDEPLNLNLESHFDFVLSADVVYSSISFIPLLETAAKLLKPGGQFILFNPARRSQLEKLIKLAEDSGLFKEITSTEQYDPVISEIRWNLTHCDPNFNTDWHYPHKTVFTK